MTFINTLIEAITTGITALIAPVIKAIHSGFETMLYGETVGTDTETLTPLAYFLFVFLGVNIGVGLVWLAISLFKRRG